MILLSSCHCAFVSLHSLQFLSFFFFNDTATTEIYTLSLHDALPVRTASYGIPSASATPTASTMFCRLCSVRSCRSEEHTSELQSLTNLVCRLLLEKKKKKNKKQ